MRKSLGIVGAAMAFALPAASASASQFLALTTQSIVASDPTQTGHLTGGMPGTCATPGTNGTHDVADTALYHYDRYPFTNQTDQTQCVTVTIAPAMSCMGLQSAGYTPSYSPTAITANLMADSGTAATTFEFPVDPGQPSVVVVNESTANSFCGDYAITLTSNLPWATVAPTISGGAVTGETLTVASTWGTPAPTTITRQWRRCDARGVNCTNIADATGTTYVPTDADVGRTLRVVETATDGAGTTSSLGPPTVPVQSGRPRPAYTRVSSSLTLERSDTLLAGSQADDAVLDFALPFPVGFYGVEYSAVKVGTNGVLQFESDNPTPLNAMLPTSRFGPTIAAHWDDLDMTGPGEGIYTSVTGTAPNRVLQIEWRANLFPAGGTDAVNFAVRLREDAPHIALVYGVVTNFGAGATVGLQAAPASPFSDLFAYNAGSLPAGLLIEYTGSRPSVSGTAHEGSELTATDASWIGPGPITTSFQWLHCDAAGADCTAVEGAGGTTFTPTAAHVGRRIRAQATATNSRGSTPLLSAPTAAVTSAGGPPAPDKTAPVITSLSVSNREFRVARGVTPVTAQRKKKTIKRGTNVLAGVSEPGKARYTIQRERRGRLVGKRCVKSTRKLRKRKRCYRYNNVQTFNRSVRQGRNTFWFTGRIGTLALLPDRYRVVLRVTDAAGNQATKPRWARFRIVG